jgi:glycosyltransferase involved in cell wall biosynthesis
VDERVLPTFDLVVATLGERPDTFDRLLESLAAQTYAHYRLVVVEQGDGRAVAEALAARPALAATHLRAARGLARARNVALEHLEGDLVAFPDDDCTYVPDLLERVAARFAQEPGLQGLTGRTADSDGTASPRWGAEPTVLQRHTVWHGGNSASTFLRATLVRGVGDFDERLGLGSGTPWESGEEIDYLVRALALGARIEYDPSLVVTHATRDPAPSELVALGRRDGGSVGFILGKHRYPRRTVARMLVRPLGGALVDALRRNRPRARFHFATFTGRLRGYRAGRAG